jgi:tRNA A37 threonylcarbamoyladenosine biosynthesis protein TsaE
MRKPGDRMYTTEYVIHYEVFRFSGQSEIDVWNIREMFHNISITKYCDWLVEEILLCLLQI